MTIIVKCFECEKRYRCPDERAGKRFKCRECETILTIPEPDEPPRSDDGTAILRHEARDRDFELATGDEQNIEAVSDHIEQHIGPVEMVFHEIISDLVHIDVHWVKPTKHRPLHTLVTSGMSDLPMTVPDELKEFEFAELLVTLPKDWKIDEKSFENERWYWPVRLLKGLARLPHEYETWLGVGHTIPNDDPPEPYDGSTKLCGSLIAPPVTLDEEFHELECPNKGIINFYSVLPLYNEEMDFKLSKGLEGLIPKLEKHQVTEVIDTNRVNTCRKKRFGFF
ncbi:MAG: suppressor of fused domain protein [Fuerstiella sp.]